jgi:hypothetical protein
MKLNVIANNQTELHLNNGTIVFFSYNTPVAARLDNGTYVTTEEVYSPTTTKHVNKWLLNEAYTTVTQQFIDELL